MTNQGVFLRNILARLALTAAAVAGLTAIQSGARTGSVGSQTEPSGSNPKLQFSPGALLRVELDSTIDVKKVKVGDSLVVKLTDDLIQNGTILAPKGSGVLGRITQATQHQDGSPSLLGLTFDRLQLKDGSEIVFKAIIQALGFPDESTVGDQANAAGQPADRGPLPGQSGGSRGTMGQPSAYPGGRMPGGGDTSSPKVMLSPNAKGVVGMPGIALSTGPEQDSVISSEKHNVKLGSGAQMILRVQ
jgi:hypothetical protein